MDGLGPAHPKKEEEWFVGPPVSPTRLGRAGPVLAQPRWLAQLQPNLYLII